MSQILWVDDEIDLLQPYIIYLKGKGYELITATNGEDAIDLLDDQIVTELGELIKSNPGKTKVFFQLIDGTGKHHVLLRSTTKTVDVKSVLVNFIDHTPALDYKIN